MSATTPDRLRADFEAKDSSGDGGWFAAGGVADNLPPGPALAGFMADAKAIGLAQLTDDELIGMMRAARRLASWSAAMELAAAGDLWRRRWTEEEAGSAGVACHADDEIAAALTLTRRAADQVLSMAVALRRLPLTSQALTAGVIDLPRAMVIADEVTGLGNEHAAAVEQAIIGAATDQTTGQLRAATRRAVLAADPGAARKRKERALQEARVERWDEHGGTAALAGRDLPPASVLAADQNLSALARQLKRAGAPGTLDQLRAQVYLALLTGSSVCSLVPAGPGIDSPGDPPGSYPGLAGDPPAGATPPECGPPGRPGAFGGLGVPAEPGPFASPGGSDSPDSPGGPGLSADPGRSADPGAPGSPGNSADPSPSGDPGSSVGPDSSGISASLGTSGIPAGPAAPGTIGTSTGLGVTGFPGASFASGTVNLTMPFASWLGLSDAPGAVAGLGPLDADDSRAVAEVLSARPGTRWCLTLTDSRGRPVAHGCAGAGPPPSSRRAKWPPGPPGAQGPGSHSGPPGSPRDGPGTGMPGDPEPHATGKTWTFSLTFLTADDCDHAKETGAYRPSPGLRHLIEIRHATCTYPGCRQPATRCDADHTVAYHRGGRTCLCNLAPLCRRHHAAKQASGWNLQQASPGVMNWTTPAGRRYVVGPSDYPD